MIQFFMEASQKSEAPWDHELEAEREEAETAETVPASGMPF